MKDSQDSIIYVGKSKNLKQRVQSYFRHSKDHSPKVKRLITHLKDFDYIQTDTEFEALLLECQYIKEIKPLYNRLMKSPLSFSYIQINQNEVYPSITVSTMPTEKLGYVQFGPYTSKRLTERAVQGLKEHFRMICSNPYQHNRPCLNFSLGRCFGICLGGSAVDQYQSIVNRIKALLSHTDTSVLQEMEQTMVQASEAFDYETAASYRDIIQSINSLLSKENVIHFTEKNHTIVMIDYINVDTIKLFLLKRTTILFCETYVVDWTNHKPFLAEVMSAIVAHLQSSQPSFVGAVSRQEIDQAQIIYSYLHSNNCRYFILHEDWLTTRKTHNIAQALSELIQQQK